MNEVERGVREQAAVERSRRDGGEIVAIRGEREEESVEIVGDLVVEEDVKIGGNW